MTQSLAEPGCARFDEFTWRDTERTVVFGRGAVNCAPDMLERGYLLLTSQRAASAAPQVAQSAHLTIFVDTGTIETVAASLLHLVRAEGRRQLVALGGGRIIDITKAVACALGWEPAAIPTTLSGAEMTRLHRRAGDATAARPGVRPRFIINDPDLSASQPLEQLAGSSANALAHAVEAPLTTIASPVPAVCAHGAAQLIRIGWTNASVPNRTALAQASILAGCAIDIGWYGISHVCAQALVRHAGIPHSMANAAVLPHAISALERRFPDRLRTLDETLGASVRELALGLARAAGATSLSALGTTAAQLDICAALASERQELALMPPVATRREIRAIYEAAF